MRSLGLVRSAATVLTLAALVFFAGNILFSSTACAPIVGAPIEGSVSGRVVKGPVKAALVTAFAATETGRKGAEVGTATTDDDGAFVVNVGGHQGPLLVCARDGTFIDEATGIIVGLSTNEMCAFIDAFAIGEAKADVLVTPLSSLHASLTGCFAERDAVSVGAVSQAAERAALRLNDFFSAGTAGFDFRRTQPLDVTTSLAPSLTPEAWHGLLLAGLSESAQLISLESALDPGVRVTAATLLTELLRDIDDGRCVLDGQGPSAGTAAGAGSASLAQGSVALSASTLRGAPQGLAQAIGVFVDGERNASGIARASVEDLIARLAEHESEIFGESPAGDIAAPQIEIREPLAGAVSGTPAIVVFATDDSAISELVFTEPASLVGTGTLSCPSADPRGKAPSSCTLTAVLNTALLDAGEVTLSVRATDEAGNTATASVTVTVNNSAPTIAVSAPAEGTCSGVVRIQAVAADADGLSTFVVEVPGTTFGAQCAPPLVVEDCDQTLDPAAIDVLWDTTALPEGPLTLTFIATDTAGNPAFRQLEVTIDNIEPALLSGHVDVGAPVVGAVVTAFEATDGTRGTIIGTDTTGDDGAYAIENATFSGVVEVVAEGGVFEDPATGQVLSLRSGQELVAAKTVTLGEEATINVNMWTTLAARRAHATLGESPSFAQAVSFNAELFASHLVRPGSLSLTEAVSANLLTDTPAPSDASALLALSQAGLSRMAAQLSIDVGGAVGQLTSIDLLDVLSLDLDDGVLDGVLTGPDGSEALFLDQATVPADSQALRSRLVFAIDAFVKNAPLRDDGVTVLEVARNNSGIDTEALSGPGLLYDDIALDRSVLFPFQDPVIPFDQTPPTIALSFGAPNDAAAFGAVLDGVVTVQGTASDASGVSAFDVVLPEAADLFSPLADVRVDIDGSTAPNELSILETCGVDIRSPELSAPDPERQVCVCVEAVDALENSAVAAQCFTRRLPVVTSSAGAFLGRASTSVQAHAEGSFDLVSCTGTLLQDGAVLSENQAVPLGNTENICDVTVSLPLFLEGRVTFAVDVMEIGGSIRRSSFQTIVDRTAPVVAVIAPTAGLVTATPPSISATASDAHLASVTADVLTSGEPVTLGLVGVLTGQTAQFPAFVDALPDGARTIRVRAVDQAGNESISERSYTKDATPPALFALTAAEGNALRHFQLTATTDFSPSSACSVFPFTGCIFDVAAGTLTEDVDLRTSASSVETYRRWQHLITSAVTPSSTANPPVENRAPTLRMRTDANIQVEARITAECLSESAFETAAHAKFNSSSVGLVDVPLIDMAGLTGSLTGSTSFLRNETGARTLCLTMRAVDGAGNCGALVRHFFRYEATPAPVHFIWNSGPYDATRFQEDVGAFDDGRDDEVLSGQGQGASGRVIAHAYLVSPSTSTAYTYNYGLNDEGPAPRMRVRHRQVVHISKNRAFNWCYTHDGSDADTFVDDEDDDFVNPDQIISNTAGSPPNEPFWSGGSIDSGSTEASWALFSAMGSNLTSAAARLEHRDGDADGETDSTFSHDPRASYPTDAHTVEEGQLVTMNADLAVSLEAWSVNLSTGLPSTRIDSGETVAFTAGSTSAGERHRLLLFRGAVPGNAVTLRTAQALDGMLSTLGFNDICNARNAQLVGTDQMFAMPNAHFVVTDQSIPGLSEEPLEARRLLWVRSGQFSECDNSPAHDCRYGRSFDDYVSSLFSWQSGRSVTARGKISAVSGAVLVNQDGHAIPAGTTRSLSQEP